MSTFIPSVTKVLKGAGKAFQTFPAAIANAFAFALVTIIRIHLDWPEQEPYNFLFNCLHWSFALGAVFSLTTITTAKSRFDEKKYVLAANLVGILAAGVTFFLLFYFAEAKPSYTGSRYSVISTIAATRVSISILVSFLTFIVLAGYPHEQSDFARSFFMTHKAFFIAILYGLVIMGGASGVAGAIQALLYHDLSNKVYMYIGTLSGFLAFTIFTGYFPDFRKGSVDKHRDTAQKQPRFIEVLFDYIMIPIMLALTIVLILWAGRTVLSGMETSFFRLSSIASSYALGGIWLHIMVTHHDTGLARFYRRIYPIAALIILEFEAWALITQLQSSGLKTEEYFFAVVWMLALSSVILLIVVKSRAHHYIVIVTCVLAVITVFPVIGSHVLPVTAQINRLENLLIKEGMLEEDKVLPATKEPELSVREGITDAVNFLAFTEDAKLPAWFDKNLWEGAAFKSKFGFEQVWPHQDPGAPGSYLGTSLFLPPGGIDISSYDWAIDMQNDYRTENNFVTISGERGEYQVYWIMDSMPGIPSLKILLDGRTIIENDLNDYIDKITEKYPPGQSQKAEASFDDMNLELEAPEISVMLVLRNIDINVDPQQDIINYWVNPDALYLKEK
jgi:hypothetical protein